MKSPTKKAATSRRAKTDTPAEKGGDFRAEYDFRGGVRGKYARLFGEDRSVRVVVLAPDIAHEFHSSRAVNAALRRVLKERAGNSRTGAARESV